jgi:hypothetical protein
MPPDKDFSVTFSLAGYQPQTVPVQVTQPEGEETALQPNPVEVELAAASKTPAKRKPAARKPATTASSAPKPAAAKPAAARPASQSAPAAAPGSTDPWPAPPAR